MISLALRVHLVHNCNWNWNGLKWESEWPHSSMHLVHDRNWNHNMIGMLGESWDWVSRDRDIPILPWNWNGTPPTKLLEVTHPQPPFTFQSPTPPNQAYHYLVYMSWLTLTSKAYRAGSFSHGMIVVSQSPPWWWRIIWIGLLTTYKRQCMLGMTALSSKFVLVLIIRRSRLKKKNR